MGYVTKLTKKYKKSLDLLDLVAFGFIKMSMDSINTKGNIKSYASLMLTVPYTVLIGLPVGGVGLLVIGTSTIIFYPIAGFRDCLKPGEEPLFVNPHTINYGAISQETDKFEVSYDYMGKTLMSFEPYEYKINSTEDTSHLDGIEFNEASHFSDDEFLLEELTFTRGRQ